MVGSRSVPDPDAATDYPMLGIGWGGSRKVDDQLLGSTDLEIPDRMEHPGSRDIIDRGAQMW